jgi:hypothetical protein
MPTLTQSYDEALHAVPAPSTLMAEALRGLAESQLARGEYTREEVFAALESLFERYADEGRVDEREAVADVMDCFVGWAPPGASL